MKPEKQKKKAGWVTVTVNILFILAICAVGWRIVDYLIQEKESADLSERLWQQAAVSKPAVEEPTGEQAPQAAFSDRTAEEPAGEQLPPPADSEPTAKKSAGEQVPPAAASEPAASSRYPDDPNAPEQINFDSLREVSKDA
ncbi:MAG: hypothetical protein IKG23_06015 [Clostridia bacterium]|nr:hypothetical protein [Clostridia bacterium]